ncbi:MAG: TetR/AcrR family transcriptional regulator [Firmicutes bacterium]|nr:TetR/AcrR family transcriptional regulator [Bacillota bacterium]
MISKSRRRISPDERRQEIRQCARDLFIARGFEQVKMSDIAAEMGISRGLMYNYYDSPNAILEDLFALALDNLKTHLQPILQEATRYPLTDIIQKILYYLITEDDLLAVFYSGGSLAFHQRREQLLRDQLEPLLRPYLPNALSGTEIAIIISLLEGVVVFVKANQQTTAHEVFTFIASLLEQGLTPFWKPQDPAASNP